MASFIRWLLAPYHIWKYKRARRKILKELHNRDPFIY